MGDRVTSGRFRLDPRLNTTFGLAVLHVITVEPSLGDLSAALVLKGGAAMLLAYGSSRMTRGDLDFDVRQPVVVTEDHANRLIALLRDPWNAGKAVDASRGWKFESNSFRTNFGPIDFHHARARSGGRLSLQISCRRVPPYLAKFITFRRFDAPSGGSFAFPVMPLESIAAEKAFRSICKDGPVTNDLYDLGYIDAQPDLRHSELVETFNTVCRDEAAKLATRAHQIAALREARKRARAAGGKADLSGDARVVDPDVDDETARIRVLVGIAFVEKLAGLAPPSA
jgi:predicted nucleotidyltransferase component of viral defense system